MPVICGSVPDVREPHSKWLQDASPASGSVERFSSEWLPLLAAVPAHWSQSSLHGSGFDPFICEKFSRARHSALTVEIAEHRDDVDNDNRDGIASGTGYGRLRFGNICWCVSSRWSCVVAEGTVCQLLG